MPSLRRLVLGLFTAGLFAGAATAQDWPAKTQIRLINPYPPGGNGDVAARAVADIAGAKLKQVILVDNRPGASSIIGTEAVGKAPPDGYTIGLVSDSHAINQAMSNQGKAMEILGSKVPYDAVRDFTPVSGLLAVPLALVVNPAVKTRSLKEVIQLSSTRKNAEGMNFGTMGPGSSWFVQMHQLAKLTGAKFTDVPYKGMAPASTDLIAGQIEVMILPVHYVQAYEKSGKLAPVVVLSPQRHPLLPNTPSLAESGFPGQEFNNTLWLLAPAGTPPSIVERMSQEFNAALTSPGIKDRLATAGDPYPSTPPELAKKLRADIDSYGATIKAVIK